MITRKHCLRLFALLVCLSCSLGVAAKIGYAIYTSDNTTLTFYYDDLYDSRPGISFYLGAGADAVDPGWTYDNIYRDVTRVVFDASFANARPKSTYRWFSLMENLRTISGINYLNTEQVQTMAWMFFHCTSLTSIDVSHFNTANVKDMSFMFYGLTGVTSLDLSNFNTSRVTNMEEMFSYSTGLTNLDVSHFNTDSVTNMSYMFSGCTGLASLDVSSFNTSRVTDMSRMFKNCSGLTSLDVSGFNTANVTTMESLFSGCSGLTSLDVSHFNTANVKKMRYMFSDCSGLTSLDLSHFNTGKVDDMESMFSGCSNLTTIYAGSEWTTRAVWSSSNMFYGCTSLVGSEGTVYNSNYVNQRYAHIDGGPFNPGYLSELPDEAYVEYTPDNSVLTFYYDNLRSFRTNTTYDLNTGSNNPAWYDDGTNSSVTQVVFDRSFAYASPTTTYAWFMDMTNLHTIIGMNYLKTENVTNMARMFSGCSSLTNLNIRELNTANVANMDYMFNGCSGLVSITLPQGMTSIGQYAFNDCSSLTAITLPAGITSIGSYAFNNCSGLDGITLPSNLTSISDYAFTHCTGFTGIDIPENITFIGNSAFLNCSNLKKVFVHWTTPIHVESNVFPNRSEEWLYVPEGTRDTYKAAGVWKDFKLIRDDGYYHPAIVFFDANVEAICLENWDIDGDGKLQKDEADMVTSIGTIFWRNTEIETFNELRFFTGLTSTNVNAFDGCSNLTSITLPEGLTSISNFAFRNCTALISVILPSTLNNILINAFVGCSSLTTIDLPEGLTTIGQNAFANCSSLTFMDIPSTVTTIGASAFYGCTNLRAFGVHWTTPITADASSFPNRTNQGLYVPQGKKSTYQAADVWKDFKWILEPNDSETYVIYNETDSTLTFYNDGLKPTRPGTAYSLNTGTTSPSWQNKRAGVARVIFDESFAAVRPTTTYDWFNGMYNLKDITGLDMLNTSEVTNMRRMFYLCNKLTRLNLSNFNTGNVTDMASMFNSCNALESLDVSNFDTRNVTDMSSMFSGCRLLTSLDVYSFDTRKVTNMNAMFSGCAGLTSLEVNCLDTRKVTDMSSMFRGCTGLTSLDVTELITAKVTNMNAMFQNCSGLTSLDLTKFNTSLVTNMQNMFTGCTGLTELDLSSFDTHNVTNMYYMFGGGSLGSIPCTNLVTVYVGDGWNTAAVTSSSGMFQGCTNIVGGKGTTYDASHVDATYAHVDGGPSNPGYFTGPTAYAELSTDGKTLTFYFDKLRGTRPGTKYNLNEGANNPGWYSDNSYRNVTTVVFDASFADARPTSTCSWFNGMYRMTSLTGLEYLNTSEVTNMRYMFGSYNRPTLDLSHFDTGNVTDMNRMFSSASLTSLDLSSFDTGNVTDMSYMFSDCSSLESIDLSSFNTINVTNMNGMFYECSELPEINLVSFNTSSVTSMDEMFFDCCNLTSLDLSSFDTHNVTSMMAMFIDCNRLGSVDLSSFNTANVTDMNAMFGNCFALTSLDLSSLDTHSVTDMGSMFDSCSGLVTVYVGDEWSTDGVTTSSNMFSGCVSIVGGKGTTYDANHVDKTYAHVDGGTSNPGYFSSHVTFLRGDVNDDGQVKIVDVTALITYLMTGDYTGINLQAADCDQNGEVKISDVTALITYLMRGTW